eukprot:sb/3465610/
MVYLGGFLASAADELVLTGSTRKYYIGPWLADNQSRDLNGKPRVVIGCLLTGNLFRRRVSKLRPTTHFMEHIKRTLNVLRNPMGNREALWLALIVFALIISSLAGPNNIFVLFLIDKPFSWSYASVGYYIAFNTLLNGLITLFGLPELNRLAGDFWCALIGISASCFSSVIVGISTTEWMLFIGSGIGAIGNIATPTLRSEMSKIVSANSQGSLFSLITSVEILCVLISSSATSGIYEATHNYYHGFCFLILGGVAFLAGGLLVAQRLIKMYRMQKSDKEELIEPIEENLRPSYHLSDIELDDVHGDDDDADSGKQIKMRFQLTLRRPTGEDLPPHNDDPAREEDDDERVEVESVESALCDGPYYSKFNNESDNGPQFSDTPI